MGLRIIYGKAGTGKSTYCFNEISNLINANKKIYIITPEQFSFNAERKLIETLDVDAVLNAEVITLTRMAHRLLQEIGGCNQTQLTHSGKAMTIYSILNKEKSKLKFLSKSDTNIDLVMTAITEFKKHGILPEHLLNEIEKVDDEYLKTKLNDMYLIYNNFQEKLQGEYIEDTDLLTILAENIGKVDFIKDSLIYIDEFVGFTYQEYQVIKKFLKIAKQVTITVCTDDLDFNTNPNTDVFYSNKRTARKIIDLAKEEEINIEQIYLDEKHRFKNEELNHLEENIFNKNLKVYDKEVENIKLFLAKNQYSEIENIAKEILKKVRDQKIRYRDISVITKQMDTYSNLIRSIFAQYNIPFFIDEKRDLNQNIIVQYILSILEIFSKNFSREAVFNYIKIGFSDIEMDDIFKFENYCIKWGIKQNKFKTDFVYGITDSNKEEIEYLNELRKQIINPLIDLKDQFGNVKTTTEAIYRFLINQKIEEKIQEKVKTLEDIGQIDLANEYMASYQIILNIFDEIVLIFGEDKISIDKYRQIFKTGLKNSELGKIPGTLDQVIVGDVDRSRTHKVNTIFIVGLNDGMFPSVNRQEGFFGDSERELLKLDGIELAKGTLENLYEENFNIYKAFTTAEENLYLSYSSAESSGKSLRQSMIINKIKKIFSKINEESDVIDKKYEITNKVMTYQELLENISNLNNEKEFLDIWYLVYSYYKNQNDWNEKLKIDLKSIDYSNTQRNISKDIIEKLYGNTLNTSVSRLEKYAQCPFSYYLQYGLKLRDKEELKVQSFDTGAFMHETVDEFFKKVKEDKIELSALMLDEEKIKEIVNKIIEEKLDNGKKYTFVATAKYNVLLKRLERIVAKALKYIIEGLVYSDFNIEGTEIEFSKNGQYKPIQIELEDGKKIEIVGKIDRVDTATAEDGKYLRIIDYKSSAKNINLNEVYAGLQIQLLTYMDAVCKEEDLMPAGVLYFGLLEQIIKADKKLTEDKIEEELRKNYKMKGLILADVKVIKMQDKNLEYGTSKIIPAGIKKDGDISEKVTSGVNKEQFKILQDYIYKTIKEIAKEILGGNIEVKPFNRGGKTPCEYCNYQSICGFDTKNCENTYNYIDNKSKDDIITNMKNKL